MPKRDLERMRALLLRAEGFASAEYYEPDPGFVDWKRNSDGDQCQLYLMKNAGWIEGSDAEVGYFRIMSLGHDYLDATRDRGIWERTKEAVKESDGSMTLELVKSLAIGFARKQLEDRTGISL